MDKKRKKDILITCLFLLVSLFGAISSFFSTTTPQCVILIVMALIAFVCGMVIYKYGTEEPVRKDDSQ